MSLKHVLLSGVVLATSAFAVHADDASRAGQGPAAAADLFTTSKPTPTVIPPVFQASSTPFMLSPVRPSGADASASAGDRSKQVDISALRYYASQNDLQRVAAEIRLLRSQYPNWEPPQDLFSENRSSVEEQPLWELFGKHDYAGVRAAMDAIRQKNPDWQPSNELAQKLQLAEAHDQLVAASDAKRWADVVDVAADNRGLLACGDVDSLWRTAEALKQIGDEGRALEAYRYVLTSCDNPGERLATVQKASVVLAAPGAMDSLVALGRRGKDGRNEFDSLRFDGLRSRIGNAAAGKPGAPVSPADLDQLAVYFNTTHAPADAQLLGWYHYNRKAFPDAENWFRSALALKADPKATEGLVLTLREEGKLQEAFDLALQSRDLAPDNRKVFVQIVASEMTALKAAVLLKPADVDAFAAAVETEKDAVGAQSYGWYLLKAKQTAAAEPWFQKSLTWQPNQDAAVGLMLAAKQLGHGRVVADLIGTYRTQFPRLAELETVMQAKGGGGRKVHVARAGRGGGGKGWDAGADAIVTSFKEGRYDEALSMMDRRKTSRAEPRGLSIVRGWAQYKRGDWDGAQRTFGALQQQNPSDDTEHGLRVIQQGYLPPALR